MGEAAKDKERRCSSWLGEILEKEIGPRLIPSCSDFGKRGGAMHTNYIEYNEVD